LKSVFRKLVDFDLALSLVRQNVPIIHETENVSIQEAAGRVSALDITSSRDNPPFNRATMDGFALRSAEISGATESSPVRLSIQDEALIGEPQKVLHPGKTCIRIATGSIIPLGADCVVPIEDCVDESDAVQVKIRLERGKNIAEAGSDLPEGGLAVSAFNVIGPREVALLASLGVSEIPVTRKIRIAILSTGNELLSPEKPYRQGKIYDSNSYMIQAELANYSIFQVDKLGILKDKKDLLDQKLKEISRSHDVIILSGGSSAGNFDMVYSAIADLQPGIIFHGVMIKPGLPTVFGKSGDAVIIGLPGFPVSAYMVFKTLFLHSLIRMSGCNSSHLMENVKLARRLDLEIGKQNLIPVRIDRAEEMAYPVQGLSGSISRLPSTEGFVSIPGTTKYIEVGEQVGVHSWNSIMVGARASLTGNIDKWNLSLIRNLSPEGTLYQKPDDEAIHNVIEGRTEGASLRVQESLGLKLPLESIYGISLSFLDIHAASRYCLIPLLDGVEIPIAEVPSIVEHGAIVNGPSLGFLRKISLKDESLNLFFSSMTKTAASYNSKLREPRKIDLVLRDGKRCLSMKHAHIVDLILSIPGSEIGKRIAKLGWRKI
jgi:molybdenum cofactor synthesis domain-containing protein